MFFQLLFQHSISTYAILSDINITRILNTNPSNRTFFFFYHPSCPHCNHFKPTWTEITARNIKNKNYLLAEVNCQAFHAICSQYKVAYYPFFLYEDRTNGIQQIMNRPASPESIERILMNKINISIIKLQNIDEFHKKYENETSGATNFVLTYNKNIHCDIFKIFSKAAHKITAYSANFYTLEGNLPLITAYRKNYMTHTLNLSCNQVGLDEFITRLSYPVLPILDVDIMQTTNHLHRKTVVIFIQDILDLEKYRKLADKLIPRWQFTYLHYNSATNTVRSLGLRPKDLPAVTIYYGQNWYLYKGPLNETGLDNFKFEDASENLILYVLIGAISVGTLGAIALALIATFCCSDHDKTAVLKKKKKHSVSSEDTDPLIAE